VSGEETDPTTVSLFQLFKAFMTDLPANFTLMHRFQPILIGLVYSVAAETAFISGKKRKRDAQRYGNTLKDQLGAEKVLCCEL